MLAAKIASFFFVAFVLAPPFYYNEMRPPLVRASSSLWSVETTGVVNCVDCVFHLAPTFEILNKSTNRKTRLIMDTPLVQAEKISIVNATTAAITGYASGDLEAIAVVDLNATKEVDAFPCYYPTLSPSGKYIALVNFFPPHGTPHAQSSFVYVIYDTTMTPAKNRQWVTDDSQGQFNAGRPVYPLENFRERSFTPHASPDGKVVHRVGTVVFRWQGDSKLVFVDDFGHSRTLVTVNLSRGIADASVSVEPH